MSLNQVLAVIAIAMVLLLTLITLIDWETGIEWTVKAIIAAALIGIFVRYATGKG